jgi:hypothetical protein
MSVVPSSIDPQFATAEEAAAYDHWFRTQVQEAIEDARPSIPHHEVMAQMRAIIASKKKSQVE